MSGTFRSLISKLKNRRKSRLWRRNRKNSPAHEEEGGDPAGDLTKKMSGLSLNAEERLVEADDGKPAVPYVFGDENFTHEFDIPDLDVKWPGPKYDETAQFAPGIFDKPRHPKRRPRQRASKRRLSHDDRPALQKRDERAASQIIKAVSRRTRISQQPQYHGPPAPRTPPSHLLNLPGEIRNHIFKYVLCLEKNDSVIAQFRLVIKPKRGRGDKAHTIRRLPREPSLALVCHKLQHEVLSLFYGETKFIFNKTEFPKLAGRGLPNHLTMTHDESIRKWTPKFGFADCVRHVEVHFKAREPTFNTFSLTYTISKLPNDEITIHSDTGDEEFCTCFEKEVLRKLRLYLESRKDQDNVPQLAAKLSHDRRMALREDTSMSAEFPYKIYRPMSGYCGDCGMEFLREIWSGL